MSRLGLYLSTREYAGLLPDSRGLRDFFFFFFVKGTGILMSIGGFCCCCIVFCFVFVFYFLPEICLHLTRPSRWIVPSPHRIVCS